MYMSCCLLLNSDSAEVVLKWLELGLKRQSGRRGVRWKTIKCLFESSERIGGRGREEGGERRPLLMLWSPWALGGLVGVCTWLWEIYSLKGSLTERAWLSDGALHDKHTNKWPQSTKGRSLSLVEFCKFISFKVLNGVCGAALKVICLHFGWRGWVFLKL